MTILPKTRVQPQCVTVRPGQVLFVTGMGRIDYVQVSWLWNSLLVFYHWELPVIIWITLLLLCVMCVFPHHQLWGLFTNIFFYQKVGNNWILTSCQLCRAIQLSHISKCIVQSQKISSYSYNPFLKSNPQSPSLHKHKINPNTNIKQNKHQIQFLEELVSSILHLLKQHI